MAGKKNNTSKQSRAPSKSAPSGEESAAANPEVLDTEVEELSPLEDLTESSSLFDEEEQDSNQQDASKSDAPVNFAVTPAGKDLIKYDPLEAYLREVRSYRPLVKEEERELAIRYFRHKDLEAAYKLVTGNLWLVVKIARDYEKAARGLLDLIQEGNIGLMEAVKNFDPYRGVRFPSYASWWVKAYIVRYLIANWRLVKIGTTQAQRKLFFNLKKERDKLEREGFYPAPKLLAEKLQVKESEVIEMEQRLGASDLSVDAPLNQESDANLLTVLPAPVESQEELLDRKKLSKLIGDGFDEFATTLKPNELVIFRERMLGEEKETLQEISQKLRVSRERVRQIENRIKEKLRKFLEERLGPVALAEIKEELE